MICEDDPKKLLRCPAGCGMPIDFTRPFKRCLSCDKTLCKWCAWTWKKLVFCKTCHEEWTREVSRG